jgi:hypothetical protein
MDGLLWESTVFWHWDGPCYGTPDWAPLYDSCVVHDLGGCTKEPKDDDGNGGDPPPPEDPPPPPLSPPGVEADPGHGVSNTLVGGNADVGRLFWRELIPED